MTEYEQNMNAAGIIMGSCASPWLPCLSVTDKLIKIKMGQSL